MNEMKSDMYPPRLEIVNNGNIGTIAIHTMSGEVMPPV